MCVKYLAARRRNWSLIARTSALMDDWWPPGMLPSLAHLASPRPSPASNAGRDCTRGPLGNTPKKSHHCFTGVCILFIKSCSGHRVGQHDFVHARTHAHTRTHACTVITLRLVWRMLCVSTTWASSLLKEMKGNVLVGTRRTFHGH